jgi:hypothetical protein
MVITGIILRICLGTSNYYIINRSRDHPINRIIHDIMSFCGFASFIQTDKLSVCELTGYYGSNKNNKKTPNHN